MARTKDPHLAAIKSWETRRRTGPVASKGDWQKARERVDITSEVTAAYSGQVNGTLRARAADGRTLAYLDWARYGDEVSVSMVETSPDARGLGLARALVEKLLDEHPDARLDWGMTTPDGTKLRKRLEASIPRLRKQVEREHRARESAARAHRVDLAEYRRLVASLKPGMSAAALNRINDRLNEIDSKWGGDVKSPRLK